MCEEPYAELIELLNNIAPGYGSFINAAMCKKSVCTILESLRKVYGDHIFSSLLKIAMARSAKLYGQLVQCFSK
uniref:Uncharacterized protein n=1 Tax=Ignisphaera aggregans TaxID=334771 RepID=A0A7J2TB84_9CREN